MTILDLLVQAHALNTLEMGGVDCAYFDISYHLIIDENLSPSENKREEGMGGCLGVNNGRWRVVCIIETPGTNVSLLSRRPDG